MTESPIDAAVLQALQATTDADFARELVRTYLADADGLVARLGEAVKEKSPGDVRLAAHSLKSSSATVGAAGVSRMAKELEAQAKADQLEGAGALYAALKAEFARVRGALEDWARGE